MNLEPMIEDMYLKIEDMLETVGWERWDVGYFVYNRNTRLNNHGKRTLPESSIVLYPVLLSYWENGKSITKIWFKSKDSGQITDKARQKIFSAMKPFKDEDYRGDDFWINPEYSDGYWCNHALG